MGWKPDLICGTSIGATNAAAIGSGFGLEELEALWRRVKDYKVCRIPIWQQIKHILFSKGFTPIADVAALQKFIADHCDIPALRKSEIEIIITAVNVRKSQVEFFDNRDIAVEHLIASCSMPVLLPWQYIDGEPYWDGGVMMNTPLLPAVERNAKEIIIVFLSPSGTMTMDLPRSRREALELSFEQEKTASYASLLYSLNRDAADKIKILTVAPRRMLGIGSLLNFSAKQVDALMLEGYSDAREQLGHL